jgi:hypothetical protein
LEDAFPLRDLEAVIQLIERGALLVPSGGPQEARGRVEIARAAAEMAQSQRLYLADPRHVLLVRDTALILSGCAVNVVRRGHDGSR